MAALKPLSVILALVAAVLVAATLVPSVAEYRTALTVAAVAAALAVAVAVAAGWRSVAVPVGLTPPRPATAPPPPPSPPPAAVKPVPPPVAANAAEADVVGFLAALQEKGRLVDFLQDDIAPYSDAQVGAAARVVHGGCAAVLRDHFRIVPVRPESEGSRVTVAAGYPADEYRFVGKIGGAAPFTGTLMHRGWKTEAVTLPRVLRADPDRLPTIAPAEVELA